MDSSPAAAGGYLLRRSSSSNHHFLNLFSPPPYAVISGADDFNESEVLWTADFGLSNHKQKIVPSNSGVLVALANEADFDSKQRIGSIVTRESSMAMGISCSSSQSIPIPRPRQTDGRRFEQSAPIDVPKAMRKQRNNNGEIVVSKEEEEEEEMLAPHEIARRGSGVSANTTFSVLEGVGRSLKGRDLRRVRNAVWHRTGFLD